MASVGNLDSKPRADDDSSVEIEGGKVNYANDENKERGNWGNQCEFILSLLGAAVGLGNIWRFPYLCFKNGGAIFLVPYAFMMLLVGMPIFTLELCLGQFTSSGPVSCWKMARVFSGLGWAMVVVSGLVAIYYNMIIGWALWYFVASFTMLPSNDLPWTKCIVGKSSKFCTNFLVPFTNKTCAEPDYTALPTGVCVFANGSMNPKSENTTRELGFWDVNLAKENNLRAMVPSESYLYYTVWGRGYVEDLNSIGSIKWELVLCLLAAWIFLYVCLVKGIKTSGKVIYFMALFPYVVLTILLVQGASLDGHELGVNFYMTARFEKLLEAQVWMDAAVQVFFSLGASWGGIIALSSYNKFHNDCIRDALIVSIADCLTSFYAGFVIFVWLGSLAFEAGVGVADVIQSGAGLAFVVYTRAVATIPAAPFWAIIFFLMLMIIGLDSEFALVETMLTSWVDAFPQHRTKKPIVMLVMCVTMFVAGLPLCTQGGTYIFDIMNTYAGGWNVLLMALLECLCLSYIYGIRRFLKDIQVMITPTTCFPGWYCFKYWWAACWCFFTPLSVSFVMMFDWLNHAPLKYDNGKDFDGWAQAVGWLMSLLVVVAIVAVPIYHFVKEKGSFLERLEALITPTVDWGPALVQHRELITHVDGWVVDPKDPSYQKTNGKAIDNEYNFDYEDMTGEDNPTFIASTQM